MDTAGGDLEFPFTTGPRTRNPLRKMIRGYIGAARDLGYKDSNVAQALGVRVFQYLEALYPLCMLTVCSLWGGGD